MDYTEVKTKKEFLNLLSKVKREAEKLANKYPEITMYLSIFNQLSDVNKLLEEGYSFTEDEIYNRYSFGAIAVKNFDCDEDLFGRELQDLFGALFEYETMPQN